MSDIDDFELINDPEFSNEETFESIDVHETSEQNVTAKLTTASNVITSPIVSKPLTNEIHQVVQQHTPNPIVKLSLSTFTDSSIKTIDPITPPIESQKTVPLTIQTQTTVTTSIQTQTTVTTPIQTQTTLPPPKSIIIPPIPPLPKPPALQRYGEAALIPHSLDQTAQIEAILNKSKTDRQNTLTTSLREQQKQQLEIQAAVEKQRNLFQKK